MKLNVTIIFLFISLLSCEKDNSTINIKGYWVNLSESKDSLLIKEHTIYRNYSTNVDLGVSHTYTYEIIKNSLVLTYKGPDKVYFIKPFVNKYIYNETEQILTIEDFEKVYPGYKGDTFKLVKKN